MATDIGIIKTLIGTATATTPSGVQRNLNVGDKVEQDELISTGVLGAIEVEFDDGSVMTLGRNSQATLSNELFGFDQPQQDQLLDEQPSSDVESIQQAILEGEDPTQTAEATAAGAGVEAGNEGSDFVQVVYENPQVIPDAGFDTTGISFAFDEEFIDDGPIDSSNSLLANQFIDDTPTAGTTILLLDEDDLSAGFIAAGYAAIDTAFETSTGFTASPASKTGNNDLSAGDDLPQNASTVLSGTLNVDFGDNGAGEITFNAAGTQPQGITSNGSELEYWVSDDGHTLVGFVATGDGSVEVVFTAEITNPQTGEFTAVLYGSVDHTNTGSTMEENLAIDLGFTVTDSDGDPAQGILRFDIDDEVPVIGNGDIAPENTVVDEEGLATAATQDDGYDGDVAGAALTANGDLNINWGADDGDTRQVTFATQTAPAGLTSNGEAVSYSISADGTVLTATAGSRTVFTVELSEDGRGTYDFTLLDNLDHPTANTEDDIDLSFSFVATDADGDSASASFTVTVDDDAPLVVADDNNSDLVKEDVDLSATGNVLANDSLGADSGKVTSTGVLLGTFGQISFAENGDYTYQLIQNNSEAIQKLAEGETVTDEFEYIVTDGDGDQKTSTVTITITGTNDIPEVEALNAQTNEDTSITFTVADLLAGASDIDETDTLSVENVTLAAGDGELVDNSDGTWTYVPADNSDVDAVINFDVTDGIASVPNTLSIEVVAVADQPNLLVSVGKVETDSSEQTINVFNASRTDKGFTVKAYGLDGNETSIGERLVNKTRGFGVDGNASGANVELGSNDFASERLEVQFANNVTSIDVSFAWLNWRETAEYTFYLDGVAVGQGTTDGITDRIDGPFTLSPDSGEEFDRVDFTAPLNRTDDYLINSITFEKVDSYSYELNIESSLTDVDGSEVLGVVSISSLPDGVTFDGTNLISSSPLTDEQINQITASVTSTETSNGDVATTTVNAKVEFDALDASAETSDLLIKGTSASESIIGGAGDDVIFGGAGDDVINGGDGADQFVWNDADVGTVGNPASDTLNDFDANEGDVLNLSDLLSDPSENNTITGLENNGHLEIQISNGADVVQTIDITSIAVANDAAAVAQLNTMLANGSINDGI